MPNLNFQVTGVEAVARGLTPLLHFKLRVSSAPDAQPIETLLLNSQIQLECPQRSYLPAEVQKLSDLFGKPQDWGRSLRNRLWTHASATVGPFNGSTETILPVACTFDLNIAAAKYFYSLQDGEVPLLFLFSGSVFYTGAQGRLQVERVSWSKECHYRLPIQCWKDLMDQHYPNSGWLALRRDVFDRLCDFKRRLGLATWEQALDSLLAPAESGLSANGCDRPVPHSHPEEVPA